MDHGRRRWQIGGAAADPMGAAGLVALTADELAGAARRGTHAVSFAEAMAEDFRGGGERIDIYPPQYRGKALIPVLGWLVTARLAVPGATVNWLLEQNQGPNSVLRMLTDAGWSVTKKRAGTLAMLTGSAPRSVPDPTPEAFEDVIGTDTLRFESDYGVFAAGKVDDGTRLLLDVALREPAVDVLADIGVGYGPLAIGLVRNKTAGRAIATDIDAIALWLAARNAAHNGVELDVRCTADPTSIEPTALTVCNVPTHVNQAATEDLMAGLLRRADHGRLLVVVHISLQARYERYFRSAGHSVRAHRGPSHVVLATG